MNKLIISLPLFVTLAAVAAATAALWLILDLAHATSFYDHQQESIDALRRHSGLTADDRALLDSLEAQNEAQRELGRELLRQGEDTGLSSPSSSPPPTTGAQPQGVEIILMADGTGVIVQEGEFNLPQKKATFNWTQTGGSPVTFQNSTIILE